MALLDDDAIARCVFGDEVEIDKAPPGTFAGTWMVWGADGAPQKELAGLFSPPPRAPWSARGVRGIVGEDGLVLTDAAARIAFPLDLSRDERVEHVVLPEGGTRLLTMRARTARDLGDESDPVTLRLWTPLGNRVGAVLLGGRRASAAAFSADGQVLAVACPPEGTALCATSPAGLFGSTIAGRTSRLRSMQVPEFSDDGRLLVFEDADQRLGAYALDGSNAQAWTRTIPSIRFNRFDAPSSSGPLVVSTYWGAVRLLGPDGGDPIGWEEGMEVRSLGLLKGDDRIVLAAAGVQVPYTDERDYLPRTQGGLTRWRRLDGTLVAERNGRLVSHPSRSNPRTDRVVVQREDGILEVDDRDGRPVTTLPASLGFRANGAEFSADGSRVVVRFYPEVFDGRLVGAARLFDAATGALLADTPMRSASGGCTAALAPDGTLLAVARPDGTTVLVDDRGRILSTVVAREGVLVLSVAFDGRGERLAIGHEDGSLDVREVAGALVFSLPPREGGVFARFTPDDRRLVTWTPRGVVAVWTLDADEALSLADARITRDFTASERERYAHLLAPSGRRPR